MRPAYWRAACKRGNLSPLRFGPTSQPSTPEPGAADATLSLRDSHAAPCPSPGSGPVTRTTDGSGLKSSACFARAEPDGSFSRMSAVFCQLTLDGSSEKFSGTWPISGALRSGRLYRRPTWEPPIKGRECSSWPTAKVATGDYQNQVDGTVVQNLSGAVKEWQTPNGCGATTRKQVGGTEREPLLGKQATEFWKTPHGFANTDANGKTAGAAGEMAKQAVEWPTPTGGDAKRGEAPMFRGEKNPSLGSAVNLWPTPKTPTGGPEAREAREARGSGGEDLGATAEMWPTAGANDHKGTAREGQRRGQLDEAAEQLWNTPTVPAPHDSENSAGAGFQNQANVGRQAIEFLSSLPVPATAPPGPESSPSGPTSPPPSPPKRRLNWRFVAWLMGFAPEWLLLPERTPCVPSEMPSCPPKRKPRSGCSGKGSKKVLGK